jgi:hypothetical protein
MEVNAGQLYVSKANIRLLEMRPEIAAQQGAIAVMYSRQANPDVRSAMLQSLSDLRVPTTIATHLLGRENRAIRSIPRVHPHLLFAAVEHAANIPGGLIESIQAIQSGAIDEVARVNAEQIAILFLTHAYFSAFLQLDVLEPGPTVVTVERTDKPIPRRSELVAHVAEHDLSNISISTLKTTNQRGFDNAAAWTTVASIASRLRTFMLDIRRALRSSEAIRGYYEQIQPLVDAVVSERDIPASLMTPATEEICNVANLWPDARADTSLFRDFDQYLLTSAEKFLEALQRTTTLERISLRDATSYATRHLLKDETELLPELTLTLPQVVEDVAGVVYSITQVQTPRIDSKNINPLTDSVRFVELIAEEQVQSIAADLAQVAAHPFSMDVAVDELLRMAPRLEFGASVNLLGDDLKHYVALGHSERFRPNQAGELCYEYVVQPGLASKTLGLAPIEGISITDDADTVLTYARHTKMSRRTLPNDTLADAIVNLAPAQSGKATDRKAVYVSKHVMNGDDGQFDSLIGRTIRAPAEATLRPYADADRGVDISYKIIRASLAAFVHPRRATDGMEWLTNSAWVKRIVIAAHVWQLARWFMQDGSMVALTLYEKMEPLLNHNIVRRVVFDVLAQLKAPYSSKMQADRMYFLRVQLAVAKLVYRTLLSGKSQVVEDTITLLQDEALDLVRYKGAGK